MLILGVKVYSVVSSLCMIKDKRRRLYSFVIKNMGFQRLELVYSGLMVGIFATELVDFAIDLRTQFVLFSSNPS